MTTWTTRAELPEDVSAIRAVNIAAFPAHDEADLVDALRADPAAWIDGLSTVSVDAGGEIVAHSLLTRCTVGAGPALALGPCAVLPRCQRTGAGSAAIRVMLIGATIATLPPGNGLPALTFTGPTRAA